MLQASLYEDTPAYPNGARGAQSQDLGSTILEKLTRWVLRAAGGGLKGLGDAGNKLGLGISVVIAFLSFVEAPSSVGCPRDYEPVLVMIVSRDPIETQQWRA